MPRWRYGWSSSGVPLGPTVPIASPSATVASFATEYEPRWVSVTARPSAVSIVTDLPLVGTVPAYVTTPAAGATTGMPVAEAPMSTPRCWPPAYGCAGSNEKPCSTGPVTGHVQAYAPGTQRTKKSRSGTIRRMRHRLVVRIENEAGTVANRVACCQIGLQRAAIQTVARHAGEARHEIGGTLARHACLDQLGYGRKRRVRVGLASTRAEHEHDLALRRLGEARGKLGRRPAHDLLEALRQLTADGDVTLRIHS